ncbi:hypothetical protein MMC25_004705 [Agyrium rufum]|nr:hypothetical protein [Agyrium rufum]
MSSMRNAVQRRQHKERAQPAERQKWGLLEKHKDYALRAKAYNEKKKRLRALQAKASGRNPDEFHFAMMNSKTRDGGQKVASRENPVLSEDAVKLLKSQDISYIRTLAQKTRKMRISLEQKSTIGIDQDFRPTIEAHEQPSGLRQRSLRKVFTDDIVQQSAYGKSSLQQGKRSSEDTFAGQKASARRTGVAKNTGRLRQSSAKQILALRDREKELQLVERELDLQRARLNSTVGSVTKAGHRFFQKARTR